MAGNPNCPRQDKRGFLSEEDLRKRLCRNPEESGMEPYLCKCGYWHMGHISNYKKQKRV